MNRNLFFYAVMASDRRKRGHLFIFASPKGTAILLFYEIATLPSGARDDIRRIATSLSAALRSRLRLLLATK